MRTLKPTNGIERAIQITNWECKLFAPKGHSSKTPPFELNLLGDL